MVEMATIMLGDIGRYPSRLIARQQSGVLKAHRQTDSECMRRLTKQFELSGQHRDTNIRLGTREVRLKRV
jgi:hypothetical protein